VNEPLTDEQLTEWERLANEATPGPWAYAHTGEKDNSWAVAQAQWPDESPVRPDAGPMDEQETERYVREGEPDDLTSIQAAIIEGVCFSASDTGPLADAVFIATSREAVVALIQEVRRLREDIEDILEGTVRPLREAVEKAEAEVERLREENAAVHDALAKYVNERGKSLNRVETHRKEALKKLEDLRTAALKASPIWTKDGEFQTQALLFIAERLATVERLLSSDAALTRLEKRIALLSSVVDKMETQDPTGRVMRHQQEEL
jgi:hypothetical protein